MKETVLSIDKLFIVNSERKENVRDGKIRRSKERQQMLFLLLWPANTRPFRLLDRSTCGHSIMFFGTRKPEDYSPFKKILT